MSEQKTKKVSAAKKSIIAGGLIGTGGLFIAKAIGLIYSIPFSSILGSDAYMSYYGSAYRIYSYILNVFTAGCPMAIATMVAKYMTRKNYKTVLSVHRMSVLIMGMLGALGMIIMLALSGVIAPAMTEEGADGVAIMTRVLAILSIAIFFVPILSSYRGFIQGCKEMEEYAYSQAFEQIFRVAFLLGVGCLLVYGFGLSSVYALYAAVLSTSVAAIAGIIQIVHFSKGPQGELRQLSHGQKAKMVPLKPLFKEFFMLAIPYLIFAVLGYSNDIYDAILLPLGLKLSSYSSEQIQTMTSAVNYVGIKLTAIPMILSPGFVAAIIPHITTALEEKNMKLVRKDIKECINIVLYISIFLSFAIGLYAKQIYYCLFYTSDVELAGQTIQWIALEGFFGTITPVITSMMMACRMRKKLLTHLGIATVMKGVLMIPFTMWWGVAGSVMTTVISYTYLIAYSLNMMHKEFGVNFKSTFSVLIRSLIALLCMGLCGWLLSAAGLGALNLNRMACLLTTIVNGLIACVVFLIVSLWLRIPQQLFHFHFNWKQAAK